MALLFLVSIASLFISRRCRLVLLILVFCIFLPINLYADFQKSDDLFFYNTYNQSLYQSDFSAEGLYPDAYIREFVRNKKVILPRDVKKYHEYIGDISEDDRAERFKQLYYIENNYVRYFKEYAKDYEIKGDDLELTTISKYPPEITDFEDYGQVNDMLRYSFLLNKETEKEMSYFWYSWFYYSFFNMKEYDSRAYIQKGLEEKDIVIAVWDRKENLYLMDIDYYDDYKSYANKMYWENKK